MNGTEKKAEEALRKVMAALASGTGDQAMLEPPPDVVWLDWRQEVLDCWRKVAAEFDGVEFSLWERPIDRGIKVVNESAARWAKR